MMKMNIIEKILSDNDFILLLLNDGQFSQTIRTAFLKKLGNRRGVVVEGKQAEEMMELYSLYAFTNKLIIGSLDHPHGRKLRNLLDSAVATKAQLIDDVILGEM